MATGGVWSALISVCVCILFQICFGSKVIFQASPDDIKNGLTSSLTLICQLEDTAPSSNLIGRRDVTETQDNMATVTSLIVMKGDRDVAMVSKVQSAHLKNPDPSSSVSGSVDGIQGQGNYLQLTFTEPRVNQSGEYRCEVNTLNEDGHSVTFTSSLEVSISEPTIADLVTHIRQKDAEKAALEKKVGEMQTTIDILKTKVFFSVALVHRMNPTNQLQTVVFDHVFSNVGQGYDNTTGLFTCQVPGYYEFIYTVSNHQTFLYATLQVNGKTELTIWAPGTSGVREQGSNSAILRLVKGDVVRVAKHASSLLHSSDAEHYVTFSGKLISVV